MTRSTIDILAGILIALSVVKLVFVLSDVRAWLAFVRRLYANPRVISLIALALAGLVLYVLLQTGLTILHVLAVCACVSLLFIVGLTPYSAHILTWFEGKDARQILMEQWLYTAVWLLLLGWGAYDLFTKA